MARFYGSGVKRKTGIPLRLTPGERKDLTRRARGEGLSRAEYARRKIFDLPLPSYAEHSEKPNGSEIPSPSEEAAIPAE